MKLIIKYSFVLLITYLCLAQPALAHVGHLDNGSFLSGFIHPFTGADHIFVMLAVGILANQMGGRAQCSLPLAFIVAMTFGYILALSSIDLPFVEPTILASMIVIGSLIAIAIRLPMFLATTIVFCFAIFHGHAHGSEIGSAQATAFGFGFILASMTLMMIGFIANKLISLSFGVKISTKLIQIGGAIMTFAGLYIAFNG